MKETLPVEKKCIKEIRPLELTLNDCLACSGCITSEEEERLTSSDLHKLSNEHLTRRLFIISPYSKIKIYKSLFKENECSFEEFEVSLVSFLETSCNAEDVVDSSSAQRAVLESVLDEFKATDIPIITSDCPGTVAYIERNGAHLVGNLSKILTPQQVCAGEAKEYMEIVSIVPCYDKKLEKNRDGCKIGHFVSTREFEEFLRSKGFQVSRNISNISVAQKTSLFYGSPSGGYTEFLIDKMNMLQIDVVEVRKNYWIHRLERGARTYTFHKVYGVKNVLNMISRTRKKLDFDFAEVFLCEGACANGPYKNDEREVSGIISFYRSFQETCLGGESSKKRLDKRSFKAFKFRKTHFPVEW